MDTIHRLILHMLARMLGRNSYRLRYMSKPVAHFRTEVWHENYIDERERQRSCGRL